MAHEIETKVLDINTQVIVERLQKLGAQKLLDTRLTIDWFRPSDWEDGSDPWYLRIRSDSTGKTEITWKGTSTNLGIAHVRPEINLAIPDAPTGSALFKAIGLTPYAHQKKDRQSFALGEWRFDLDQYPNMPPYLEIEGPSEASIKQAMAKLGVEQNRTWNQGERTLIEQLYGLNWHAMRFKAQL